MQMEDGSAQFLTGATRPPGDKTSACSAIGANQRQSKPSKFHFLFLLEDILSTHFVAHQFKLGQLHHPPTVGHAGDSSLIVESASYKHITLSTLFGRGPRVS